MTTPASRTPAASDWRPQIARVVDELWPGLADGAFWIEAQVQQESGGRAGVVSSAGASGLLQLMPLTAKEVGVLNVFDPVDNLRGGVKYLLAQYNRLPEIPEHLDRLKWALAAYNGGRGYVNAALMAGQRDDPKNWHRWDVGRFWLMHRECRVRTKYPDYRQMWDYVARIVRNFNNRTTGVA